MLETGDLPAELWTDDVFIEGWVPVSRMQWRGRADASLRFLDMHPDGEEVLASRATPTVNGAVVELVVRTRETPSVKSKLVAVVECADDGRIREMRIHCTGDWTAATEDAVAATSSLVRREWLPPDVQLQGATRAAGHGTFGLGD